MTDPEQTTFVGTAATQERIARLRARRKAAEDGDPMYLIWSNEQRMWWRPGELGYTPNIEEAGRYTLADAQRIVASSTVNGQLGITQTDSVTGNTYVWYSEWAVPAPENIHNVSDQR